MERDEFEDLFRKYRRRLHLYLIKVLNVPMRDAEDVVIETFQRYFQESDQARDERARRLQFRGDPNWGHLRHIARDIRLKELKKARRADVVELYFDDLPSEPAAPPPESESSRSLRNAVEKLPAVDRAVLRLRTDGLTLAEIAERLDLSKASVSRHLLRAKESLRKNLGKKATPVAQRRPASRRVGELDYSIRTPRRRRALASSDPIGSDPPTSPGRRHLNVWLENADPPLQPGIDYRLGVDIGAPHGDTVVSSLFPEPDWGGRDSLAVVLVLTADHARVSPRYRPAELPRIGNMSAVFFTIRALETRSIRFRLDVVTAREGDVLESVSFVLEVARAQAVGR